MPLSSSALNLAGASHYALWVLFALAGVGLGFSLAVPAPVGVIWLLMLFPLFVVPAAATGVALVLAARSSTRRQVRPIGRAVCLFVGAAVVTYAAGRTVPEWRQSPSTAAGLADLVSVD
jgi:hypothetical protein